MTQVSGLFDNMSRIGLDECDITNKQIQNTRSANYVLENFSGYNSFTTASNLATNHPNVFIQASPRGGINSSLIDENSQLKISEISRPKERVESHKRLFTTVPFLGRGPHNIEADNHLNLHELNSNRQTENPNSEVSLDNYTYYPLIPAIESTVTNPSNLVEGVAAEGWIRGGVPSRLLNRVEDN